LRRRRLEEEEEEEESNLEEGGKGSSGERLAKAISPVTNKAKGRNLRT